MLLASGKEDAHHPITPMILASGTTDVSASLFEQEEDGDATQLLDMGDDGDQVRVRVCVCVCVCVLFRLPHSLPCHQKPEGNMLNRRSS